MTGWNDRVTIFCPDGKQDIANSLALCVGLSEADAHTFGPAKWQDGQGNRYSVASTLVRDGFQEYVAGALEAPIWAPDLNMDLARTAQGLLNVGTLAAPKAASPGEIVALFGPSAKEAMLHAGVSFLDD